MLEAVEYHPPLPSPATNNAPRALFTMQSAWSTPSVERRKKSLRSTLEMAPHPFNSILKDPMVAAPPPPVMQWQYKLPGGLGLLATVEEYYQSKDYANTDKEMVDVEEDKVDDGDINATDFNDNNNNDGSAPAEV
jgi:hypothetical protein